VGSAADAGVAENRVTFQDATAEEVGAPDITTVSVFNGDAGLILFRIDVPSHPTFTDDMGIAVHVDSDHDAGTGVAGPGDTRGWDYRILWNRPATRSEDPRLLRCDDSRCLSVPGASVGLRFSYSSGVTFTIHHSELGNTKRFRFSVSVTTGIVRDPATGTPGWEEAKWDFAPELGRTWSYVVRLAPQRLLVKSLSTSPARAGAPFTVRALTTRADTGAVLSTGRVRCAARIDARRVEVRSQGFVRGRAVCVFGIPADAAGETIRGSVTVSFGGRKVTRSFSARVRS
jgi:hypothetical protein